MSIPRREAKAILSSLGAGVVPRSGLRHVAVGRLREIAAIKQDLDQIREGGAAVRFVIGRFGSGKSFLLQLARSYALESRFVVADADFSLERRLHGTGGQALATYRELMRNLSTQSRPDGNALPAIMERWISNVQATVSTRTGLAPDSPGLATAVKGQIMTTVGGMQELVHGFDFGTVVSAYYEGYREQNDALQTSAVRWLRGEFNTRSEAREALDVRSIIDDDNFYDYLKVIARFAHDIGYAGLLICLDEAVNLFKISHSGARSSNYEKILTIVNDCLQGRGGYFGFIFGGTPEFLEDQRRGLFSYEALRTRLAASRFASDDLRDYSAPVLALPPMTADEIFVLLQKVLSIHRENVPGSRALDDTAIVEYMEESLRRIGAKEFATPRDLVREFVNLLNIMSQYPNRSWQEILMGMPAPTGSVGDTRSEEVQETDTGAGADPLNRFNNFKIG